MAFLNIIYICGYISSECSQKKTMNINGLDELPASVLDLKQYHEEINYNFLHNKKLIKTFLQTDMEF
jgi:ribosomal protein S17E